MTKQEAITHLIEREKFFEGRGESDRAGVMKAIHERVLKKPDGGDFTYIKTVGLHLKKTKYTGHITS